MTSGPTIFAGVELTSGRKPVTFAALDEALKIQQLEHWELSDLPACLHNYQTILLAVSLPSSKRAEKIHVDLKETFVEAGFTAFSQKAHARQWMETDAQDCFRAWGGHGLFPRRSLEGRLQRCAILYEQGVQVMDPVDMLEEITRYRLIQGILPLEELPSSRGLDALAAAYLAWMSVNRSGQIALKGDFALPAPE